MAPDNTIDLMASTHTLGVGEREAGLDAIIAVGYRVNSYQATQFRIWATSTLREFMIKGFVLDDERLKQGEEGESHLSCAQDCTPEQECHNGICPF